MPGIEKVALIGWPLMSGESAVGNISINGAPPGDVFSDFVTISPGWVDIMRIPLLGGRDFRASDVNPAVAIVNQAFAKQYFNGEIPSANGSTVWNRPADARTSKSWASSAMHAPVTDYACRSGPRRTSHFHRSLPAARFSRSEEARS